MNEQENGSARQPIVGNWAVSCLVLVVLGFVIGAVVFPMLARTGERPGRKSTCQVNMKNCAIALQTYWNDYDGHLPSSSVANHSKKWNRADFTTFASKLGTLPPTPTARPRTWPAVLFHSMKNKDSLFCPKDETSWSDPEATTSYWWKLAIDKAWYGEQCTAPCQTEAEFMYNADQIVMYERCGFHSGAKEGLRNGVQILAAYLDSHVKTILITNSLPADGDRWTTGPAALGEPAYFNYDFDQPKSSRNPPPPNTLANHVDPARFGDNL